MKKTALIIWNWISKFFDNPFLNIYLLIIGCYLLSNFVILPMISCDSKWLNSIGYFLMIPYGVGIYFVVHTIISYKKRKNEG